MEFFRAACRGEAFAGAGAGGGGASSFFAGGVAWPSRMHLRNFSPAQGRGRDRRSRSRETRRRSRGRDRRRRRDPETVDAVAAILPGRRIHTVGRPFEIDDLLHDRRDHHKKQVRYDE